MDQIQFKLDKYIELDTQESLIERKKSLLNRFEEKFIEHMETLSVYLKSDNFAEAAKFMKILKRNIYIMDPHFSQTLLQKRAAVEAEFVQSLKDLEKKFSEKEIGEYLYNSPKELFKKLGTSYLFKDTIATLTRLVIEKLKEKIRQLDKENELEDILEKNDFSKSSLDFERELKQIERTVTKDCLPENIYDILIVDLNDLKDNIDKNRATENEKLAEGIEKQNLKIIGYYYRRNKSTENKEKVLRFLNNKIKKCCDEILSIVNGSKKTETIINEFSVKIEKLFECMHFSFSNNIDFNRKGLYDLISTLACTIESIIQTLTSCFTTVNSEKLTDYHMYENFLFLQFYTSLNVSVEGDIKFPEFRNDYKELIEKILEAACAVQTEFSESMETWNIEVLKGVLNKMQNWDKIIKSIKIKTIHTSIKHYNLELDYSTMKAALIENIKEFKKDLLSIPLITESTKSSEYKRNSFHDDIKHKFEKLKSIKELDNHISPSINIRTFESDINENFIKNCDPIISALESNLLEMENKTIDEAVCKAIHINFVHIKSLIERLVFIDDKLSLTIKSIQYRILKVVNDLNELLTKNSSSTDFVAEQLIKMKIISENMQFFKETIDRKIDDTLKYYKSHSPPNEISKLGTVLNGCHIGKIIINEHSIFEGFAFALFSKKVAPQTIEYVLENLNGDNLNKERLKNCYDEFFAEYKSLLVTHLKKNVDYKKIKNELNSYLDKLKNSGRWNTNIIKLIPKTLAYVFLIWTLKKNSLYFESNEPDEADFYLRKPHPAQIIAIFRLLGDYDEGLKNNLCEIGTGEGKSIVLAVLAIVFAIFGYDVSCVCYSKYLSDRDYIEFRELFETLDVDAYIKYGTFNEICEDIINEKGALRNQIRYLINGTDSVKFNNSETKRIKILLIDEVDVFLKTDFYGNLYKPTTLLKNPLLKPLIEYIWKNRNLKLTFDIIKSTSENQEVTNYYKNWEFLIDESVKNLIFDAKTFDEPKYVVKNDMIGYIEHDSISFTTIYGYKTLFAYFSEHEKGKITSTSLDNNVYLEIKCGHFSYSEIPSKFKYIIGVTGTLQHLTEPERHIVETEYKINKKTYLPSVFGNNQLTFDPNSDVFVENINEYHKKIESEISCKLIGKNPGTKRAVLVFFESRESLMKFCDCKPFLKIRHLTKTLTEEDNLAIKEKDHFIKEATRSGAICLLTRSFGRGSNFICRDDIVTTNGGVHVIQTFLSEQYSEEIQIRGRTARQGDTGSFSMILLDQDLEKFSISKESIKLNEKKMYAFIHEKRNAYFVKHYNSDKDFKSFIKSEHEKSLKFLDNLKSNNIQFVRNYLKEINKGIESTFYSKTLCLIDATGSMGDLLHQTKNKVYEMFNDAIKILEEAKMNPNCFQLQFAVYRDYDCGVEEILKVSPWVTKPDDLYDFLSKVQPEGGDDYEEAIEIGLQHANTEFRKYEITQVLLIGDAPAKKYKAVQNYRSECGGEKLWVKHFGPATDYLQEAKKLSEKNIPVYTFYLAEGAKLNFEEIANITKGKCEFLDVSKPHTEQSLGYLVTRQLLANIGESCGKGNEFAEQYMQYFSRSYK